MEFSLVDEFFETKNSVIGIKGEIIEVRRARGGLDIYLDGTGRIICGYWPPKAQVGTTPFSRSKEKRLSQEKSYKIYNRGVGSAWRSRKLADLGARVNRLPQLDAVKEILQDLRVEIDLNSKIPSDAKSKLWHTGFLVLESSKKEIKEAQAKILFLLRGDGKDGRLNKGASFAVETAAADRIAERMHKIYIWRGVYADQAHFLGRLRERAENVFKNVHVRIQRLLKFEFFDEKFLLARENAITPIKEISGNLQFLAALQPFRHWSARMLEDVEILRRAIREGSKDLFFFVVERIEASIQIKQKQFEMDYFLWQLGRHEILKDWQQDYYSNWLRKTILEFSALKKREAEFELRQPVCEAVISFLWQAQNAAGSKSFAKLLRPLHKAYELL